MSEERKEVGHDVSPVIAEKCTGAGQWCCDDPECPNQAKVAPKVAPVAPAVAKEQHVEALCVAARLLLEKYARDKKVFQLDIADFREAFAPIVAEYAASLSPSRTLLESTVNKLLDDVQIITKQSAYKDHLVDHFKQSEIKHLREIDTLTSELERATGERDQWQKIAVEQVNLQTKPPVMSLDPMLRDRAEAAERSLETAREALKNIALSGEGK
jgi:hypothetical protein